MFILVVVLPLSVKLAVRSNPAGPAPPQQLELRTSTSGTEAGCSGSAADTQTQHGVSFRTLQLDMDGWMFTIEEMPSSPSLRFF